LPEASGNWYLSDINWPFDRLRKVALMSQLVANKGSKIIKTLGILTLIGVIIAVGRIVLRVFNEKKTEPEDGHNGI
jgi:hypothetical protein